jgi:hypothetical protein
LIKLIRYSVIDTINKLAQIVDISIKLDAETSGNSVSVENRESDYLFNFKILMAKFVIEYHIDNPDYGPDELHIHCIEYESLEKLKEDFQNSLNNHQKTWQIDLTFCDQIFDISSMNRKDSTIILPLEEWFEHRKQITKGD